jgi:hypothetical protein
MSDDQDKESKEEAERRNATRDRRLHQADRRGSERTDDIDAERRLDETRREPK